MLSAFPILYVHIVAGTVALVAGAFALLVRKGGRLHRQSGKVFIVSMLVMAGLGAYVATLMPQRGTMAIAFLTLYLLATSWATAKRKEPGVGLFDYGAAAAGFGIAALLVMFGLQAAGNPNGKLDAFPAVVHYPFAAMAALGAVTDVKVIAQRGVAGAGRVSRHIWRMCLGLLIAAFSFFFGQQRVMPEAIRGSPLLFLPEAFVLGMMAYWLVRVRLGRRFRTVAA